MKCLLKYPWVKLPRNKVPGGKGLICSIKRTLNAPRTVFPGVTFGFIKISIGI